ncbi:MAG TPA: DUF116 domain-containing protein [Lentimicrobium sp.]|nr:DUF116 domain-containing protein [Lentimicrobium sp.]
MDNTVHIPYNLCANTESSDRYYADLEAWAPGVLEKLHTEMGGIAEAFRKYQTRVSDDPADTIPEYLLEALLAGSFWNIYGGYAQAASDTLLDVMQQLAKLRKSEGLTAKTADAARGVLELTLMENPKDQHQFLLPGTAGLARLIRWMEASGEFDREAYRLRQWLNFFSEQEDTYAFVSLIVMRNTARWFSKSAARAMGKYTPGIESFNEHFRKNHSLREDAIAVLRDESEYHLGMFGVWVINEAMRENFLKTPAKMLLIPACLRAHFTECKASKTSRGEVCNGCTENCQVNRLTREGKKYGFGVLMLGHRSDLSAWAPAPGKDQQTGIVGVACLTTLISGGYELKRLGIAAQCIPLDHSGCTHWTSTTQVTSVNMGELYYRLGVTRNRNEQPL